MAMPSRVADTELRDQTATGGFRALQSRKFYKIHACRTDCRIFKAPDPKNPPEIVDKSSKNQAAEQGLTA